MAGENKYNRACFESICGNVTEALVLLRAALNLGQIDANWVERDPDFDFIRNDPGFQELLAAYKGKHGPCVDAGQSVVYKGPFRQVLDDDGHRFVRGRREAVCEKTFALLGRAPYAGHFVRLEQDGLAVRDMDVMCGTQDGEACC